MDPAAPLANQNGEYLEQRHLRGGHPILMILLISALCGSNHYVNGEEDVVAEKYSSKTLGMIWVTLGIKVTC